LDASELRHALRIAAQVIEAGKATHAPGEWTAVPVREHLRHAAIHLERTMLNSWQGTDNLAAAMVRIMMACEVRERQQQAAQALVADAAARRAR
jgi:hypothetical protein